MLTTIFVLAAISAMVLIGSWFIAGIKQMGIDEERLRQKDAAAKTAKKQAEIMAQPKSVNDVANDLDRGKF